jgi:formate hydrogenlyase subunit 6/NADH:ubiquinone oxidoreductase subunit I
MKFVSKLIGNLFRRPLTEPFPLGPAEEPINYRGRVAVDAEKCVGCSTCAQVCVGQAIRLEEREEGIRLMVWHASCTFCGLCEYYCPTDAIYQTKDWSLHHANADKYAMSEDVLVPYQHCADCGTRLMVPRDNVFAASTVGRDRVDAAHGPRCDACRRKAQARLLMMVQR